MSSLRAPSPAVESLDHEVKFVLAAHSAGPARALLAGLFRPESPHARSRIGTIYFDDRALSSAEEKLASDYRKTKIRLRWYDGAGPVQRFFRIILPLLKPLTAIVFILSVTYTVKVFDLIFVLTGGGPADATQTLAIHSYKLSFKQMDFGHGAAVGNVLILISLCFAFFYIRSFRRSLMAETS